MRRSFSSILYLLLGYGRRRREENGGMGGKLDRDEGIRRLVVEEGYYEDFVGNLGEGNLLDLSIGRNVEDE